MKELNLTVQKREGTGKGINRRLRAGGEIPAVVYGPESDPIPVKIDYKTLYRIMHGQSLSTLINLEIEGDKDNPRKVIIRELQKDPVSGDLVHIDFHHIPLDKPLELTIAVKTTGIPVGVKTFGGIVQQVKREIDISCLPSNIPDDVVLDISELNVGDALHVSDIHLENVEILTSQARTLVTVVAPTVIKEVAVAEGEEGEAAEGEEAEGEAGEGEEKKEEGGDDKKK